MYKVKKKDTGQVPLSDWPVGLGHIPTKSGHKLANVLSSFTFNN